MNQLFILILGIIIGGVLFVWIFVYSRRSKSEKHSDILQNIRMFKNKDNKFLDYRVQREEKKQENKRKIMEMFRNKDRVTNQEVEEAFEISDATATRYLDELEKEGKLVQKGEGKATFYTKR